VFKQRVLALIDAGVHTVLDLHGMTNTHPQDVCIGTGYDGVSPLAELASSVLSRYGLTWNYNEPFNAKRTGCVAAVAHSAGAQAVQLECAARVRDPNRSESAVLYAALLDLVTLSFKP
jgi:hypothetical protein